MIVLDTHIWLWFILGDKNLRSEVRTAIEKDPEEAAISAISIWEATLLGERGRVTMSPTPVIFMRKAVSTFPFRVLPLTGEVSLLSRELKFAHGDPADRFIAATAYAHSAMLATDDRHLREFAWLKIL